MYVYMFYTFSIWQVHIHIHITSVCFTHTWVGGCYVLCVRVCGVHTHASQSSSSHHPSPPTQPDPPPHTFSLPPPPTNTTQHNKHNIKDGDHHRHHGLPARHPRKTQPARRRVDHDGERDGVPQQVGWMMMSGACMSVLIKSCCGLCVCVWSIDGDDWSGAFNRSVVVMDCVVGVDVVGWVLTFSNPPDTPTTQPKTPQQHDGLRLPAGPPPLPLRLHWIRQRHPHASDLFVFIAHRSLYALHLCVWCVILIYIQMPMCQHAYSPLPLSPFLTLINPPHRTTSNQHQVGRDAARQHQRPPGPRVHLPPGGPHRVRLHPRPALLHHGH